MTQIQFPGPSSAAAPVSAQVLIQLQVKSSSQYWNAVDEKLHRRVELAYAASSGFSGLLTSYNEMPHNQHMKNLMSSEMLAHRCKEIRDEVVPTLKAVSEKVSTLNEGLQILRHEKAMLEELSGEGKRYGIAYRLNEAENSTRLLKPFFKEVLLPEDVPLSHYLEKEYPLLKEVMDLSHKLAAQKERLTARYQALDREFLVETQQIQCKLETQRFAQLSPTLESLQQKIYSRQGELLKIKSSPATSEILSKVDFEIKILNDTWTLVLARQKEVTKWLGYLKEIKKSFITDKDLEKYSIVKPKDEKDVVKEDVDNLEDQMQQIVILKETLKAFELSLRKFFHLPQSKQIAAQLFRKADPAGKEVRDLSQKIQARRNELDKKIKEFVDELQFYDFMIKGIPAKRLPGLESHMSWIDQYEKQKAVGGPIARTPYSDYVQYFAGMLSWVLPAAAAAVEEQPGSPLALSMESAQRRGSMPIMYSPPSVSGSSSLASSPAGVHVRAESMSGLSSPVVTPVRRSILGGRSSLEPQPSP